MERQDHQISFSVTETSDFWGKVLSGEAYKPCDNSNSAEKLHACAVLLALWVLRLSGALVDVRSGKSEQLGDNLSQFFKSVIS